MYCIHKSMRGAKLPRHLPHRNVGRAEIILHPRMGGHCVVPRNGPAYLGAKVIENGPAWRVLDVCPYHRQKKIEKERRIEEENN
jgi:hypothetical protein